MAIDKHIQGIIVEGAGVASGKFLDPRLPAGTIELQKPHFKNRGLDLSQFFLGTLNVDISPHYFAVLQPKLRLDSVTWIDTFPAEDFLFCDCRLETTRGLVEGLVYYPSPETKVDHFKSNSVLEILAPYISSLKYGDQLKVWVDSSQMKIT